MHTDEHGDSGSGSGGGGGNGGGGSSGSGSGSGISNGGRAGVDFPDHFYGEVDYHDPHDPYGGDGDPFYSFIGADDALSSSDGGMVGGGRVGSGGGGVGGVAGGAVGSGCVRSFAGEAMMDEFEELRVEKEPPPTFGLVDTSEYSAFVPTKMAEQYLTGLMVAKRESDKVRRLLQCLRCLQCHLL